MPKIRALIVDDSVVMRRLITEVLSLDERIEVVGSASNGRIALQKIPQLNPDVITLDVEMPELDGVQTLRELRQTYPRLPVIMFSALTQKGASATLEALSAGANDYVTKPVDSADLSESVERLKEDLLPKIYAHCHVAPIVAPTPPPPVFRPAAVRTGAGMSRAVSAPIDLVCIGTSTGGPIALEKVFTGFKTPIPVPVAIVQHMPPMFTRMLAQRLDSVRGPLGCEEAETGMVLRPGVACLAKGGQHMALVRDPSGGYQVKLVDSPPENSCRPAVDVLFRTAAQTGANILAVVLTGMGQDGLRGCEHIRERGGYVIAQDQASSIVWGMPGAVVQAQLAQTILPLDGIAQEISRRVRVGRMA